MPSKARYTLSYTDLDGARKQKAFYGKTKRIAKNKALEFLKNLKDQIDNPRPVIFSDWAEKWIDLYPETANLTSASINGYQLAVRHLSEYFGDMPLQSIKAATVRQFFSEFKKPDGSAYSDSMLRKVRNTFSAIMEAACDNELIYHNPVKSYRVKSQKPSRVKRAFTLDQAIVFSEYAKIHPDGLGPYILLHTGIRLSELMGIIPAEDFDFAEGTIQLHRTITDADGVPQLNTKGKTRAALRTILLDPDAKRYLNSRIECHSDDFLFHPISNNKVNPYLAPRTWKRNAWHRFIADFNANYPEILEILPGELRHCWFTLMREVNPDLRVVDLQGGHALQGLTDSNYSHYSLEWLKENTRFPSYQKPLDLSEKREHKRNIKMRENS